MASPALETFNAWVDSTNLSEQAKVIAKDRGERLYIASAKETVFHMRAHAEAVRDDQNETAGRRQRAGDLVILINHLIATRDQDAWWLDVTDALED